MGVWVTGSIIRLFTFISTSMRPCLLSPTRFRFLSKTGYIREVVPAGFGQLYPIPHGVSQGVLRIRPIRASARRESGDGPL